MIKMKIKVGVDLVDMERCSFLEREPAIFSKLYSLAERDLIQSYQGKRRIEIISGRFAAKEAVIKALDLIDDIRMVDIETLMDKQGAPFLKFNGFVKEHIEKEGLRSWDLSISHENGFAIAFVLFYG